VDTGSRQENASKIQRHQRLQRKTAKEHSGENIMSALEIDAGTHAAANSGGADAIARRLEALPASSYVWKLVILLSLGGCFEIYDLFFTGYIAPGLIRSGLLTATTQAFFGFSGIGAFVAATFAGLVFVPESPRAVTAAEARPLADNARLYGIKPVGIFRNSPTFDVVGIARSLALHAVQLHGQETTADIAALRAALPEDCEIWTAIDASETVALRGGDRTLFDSGTGGGGKAFDWKRVAGHRALACGIIAGGIGPDNVRAASALGAYAVDVGSAVDEAPGRKDPAKIAALFEAVRSPSRQELLQCA